MADVPYYDHSVADKRGESKVVITVGADANDHLSFAPSVVRVDPDTTVVWQLSVKGGRHTITSETVPEGADGFDFGPADDGSFEQVLNARGVYKYFCHPHRNQGMKGIVVVGDAPIASSGSTDDSTPEEKDEEDTSEQPTETTEPHDTDFDGWLAETPNYDGTVVDATDTETTTVKVGALPNHNLSFQPPAIRITAGTTISWEWTGEGGAHNVMSETVPNGADAFRSGNPVAQAGHTYRRTFDGTGVYKYYCNPHKGQGMRGIVIVE